MYKEIFLAILLVISVLLGGCRIQTDAERLRSLETGTLSEVRNIYSSREQVQKRLQVGSSIEAFSFPLNVAVAAGHEPVIAHLLEMGADPNSADHLGRTPLFEIPREIDEQATARIVSLLVKSSADPNLAEPVLGSTPLMQASMYGDVPLVRALLESGADLELRDTSGRTAFDQIASRKPIVPEDIRVLKELLTSTKK